MFSDFPSKGRVLFRDYATGDAHTEQESAHSILCSINVYVTPCARDSKYEFHVLQKLWCMIRTWCIQPWAGITPLFMWSKKRKRERQAFRGSDPCFIPTWTEGGFLLPRTHFFFLLATQWELRKNRSLKLTRLIIKENLYALCGKDLVLYWTNLCKQKLWKIGLNFKAGYAQTFSALPLNNTAWTSVCLHLLKSQIMPNISHMIAADAFCSQ